MAGDYDDPSLNVEITTSADNTGVEQATRGIDEVRGSAGGLTHSLRELTGTSRHTAEIVRAVGAAGSGSARGIGEMVMGLRALIMVVTEAIGATGLGALALVAGALLGTFVALSRHTHEAAGGIEDVGKKSEEAAKRMEAIKKAVDEYFKPLDDEVKRINEHFAELDKRIGAAETASTRLAKATKDLTESQEELSKARAIDAAGGDEKKIAAIDKEFEAKKKVREETEKLNTVGQEELDLKVKREEAENKAAQLEQQRVLGAAEVTRLEHESEGATKAAGIATSQFLSGKTKEDMGKGLREAAHTAQSKLGEARSQQAKLEEEAGKASNAAEAAGLAVQNEQLVTQKETLSAINRLAAAVIGQKDVDKVTVGGEPEADALRDKADAKAAATQAKDDAKTQKAAAKESAAELKEQVKSVKEMHVAIKTVGHVSKLAAHDARKIQRQMINTLSVNTSP